jgi:uncharacterized protein (DUF362 family)
VSSKINRRKFIKNTGKLGAAAVVGNFALAGKSSFASFFNSPDIVVVKGTDFFQNTIRAIDALGGMSRFVPAGYKVGLLINSDFDVPGTFVNPDISIAAVKMIFDAGASEVIKLQVVKPEYWSRSSHYDENKDIIGRLKEVSSNFFPAEFNESDFVKINPVPGGKSLKETEVVKAWLNCDVFVNIAIGKHHGSTFITGALKNIMGVSTRKANVSFHLGSGRKNDPDYLAQCIVDQNLLRKTDLCIADCTEFIINNGPSGPGDLRTENKIIAGSDIVAIDALSTVLVGYEPDEILTNVKGFEAGLGQLDYSKLNVLEITA